MKSKTKKKKGASKPNSSSTPNIATAAGGDKGGGFPPGITVDELWLYRRKRPSVNPWPSDHLKPREGSFKPLKTEYKRRFKNYYDFSSEENLRKGVSPVRASKPEDSLKPEGPLELHTLYKDEFINHLLNGLDHQSTAGSFALIDPDESEMKENSREVERLLTEIQSQYIKYPPSERPPLIKKPTTLKLEGDFYSTTEKAEKFIQYLLDNRPVLVKKPTTLKLEGEMNINTENREKYVPFELPPKPPLYKKPTNLHLEGDLNILTEKQEKFVRYEVQKRPPLTKKATNLHVEGELDLLPEYRKEFIEYKTERPKLALPVNNLKTDGFYDLPEDVSRPFQRQIHPQIPNLRRAESHEDFTSRHRISRYREGSLKPEGPMETETESKSQFVEKPTVKIEPPRITNNLLLEGRIDLNPEYRNAYIDFHKDASTLPKRRTRRSEQENHLKSEGKMEIYPEYKSSYVDFPRRRPQVKRPECSLSSEGEIDHMTEKKEKYVPFSNIKKTGPLKRNTELKLEGKIECQPEYRKAYIDYLIREKVERMPRPLDNLGQPIKRILEPEPITKTSLAAIPPPIPPPEKPKSATKESPAKSARRSGRNRSLSQIEASVFGPKLEVPENRKSSSRSNSPDSVASRSSRQRSRKLPRSQNVSNSSDSEGSSRHRQKSFGKPVLVENLASRSTTPVPLMKDLSAKNKWMKDSSIESSSAFVVLDKNVKSAYKEKSRKKWTPYWENNSFDY